MSPLIIETRDGITTIGSPGADRISSAIAQVLINFSKTITGKNQLISHGFM